MFFAPNPGVLAAGVGPTGGQQLFTASGSFIVPAGFTSICAVGIGRGGDFLDDSIAGGGGGSGYYVGAGGSMSYRNGIAVTPGETLLVDVTSTPGAYLALRRSGTTLLAARSANYTNASISSAVGDVVFIGGQGPISGSVNTNGSGASAGGYTNDGQSALTTGAKGGGGTPATGGGAASAAGSSPNADGLNYGGGAAIGGTPGAACIRIIWGEGRAFPNTNTGNI